MVVSGFQVWYWAYGMTLDPVGGISDLLENSLIARRVEYIFSE